MEMLKRVLATLRIVWMAFLVTPVVFAVVLYVAAGQGEPPEPMVPLSVSMVALMEIPAMFFVRWRMLGSLALSEPEDLRAEGRTEEALLEDAIRSAAARYNAASMVSFAFAESVMLMGFVSTYISGSFVWFGLLAPVAFGLLILIRPSQGGVMCVMTPEDRQGLRHMMKG